MEAPAGVFTGRNVHLLDCLKQRQQESSSAQRILQDAILDKDKAGARLQDQGPNLERTLTDLGSSLSRLSDELIGLKAAEEHAAHALEQAKQAAGFWGTVVGWFGLGSIGRARRAHVAARELLAHAQASLEQLRSDHLSTQQALAGLQADVTTAAERASEAMRVRDLSAAAEKAAIRACEDHDFLKGTPVAECLDTLKRDLSARHARLDSYQHLNRRFDELVADLSTRDTGNEALRRDLLAVTNLFVCTTTGIAGSQELRDVFVDTFVLDEASRVTDSEFLIGAVRAKRWILVGDEHQLPPYVEQNDEYFLHALSSLQQAEQKSASIETAVDELGRLWEEDEELHKFRRDQVSAIAETLHASGEWDRAYKQPFSDGLLFLRGEVDDPSRAMLRAMRDNLVRSLFERIVGSCPASLRVRLVEQRRMIRPIAEIVSAPVYGGDYSTPSDADLAACGVTPLTTPTFPTPITFLDTSALGGRARDELLRNSFVNRTEARWVVDACRVLDQELAAAGASAATVSILSFYRAQARLIRDCLSQGGDGLRRFSCLRFSVIDAIDRIQGQESDIVFLTFCRTAGREVSPRFGQWLQDLRRLNVACTRAHRALIFVGQKELLGKLCSNDQAQRFFRHLNQLFENRQAVMRVVRHFGGHRP
jgi:hypothetical protein